MSNSNQFGGQFTDGPWTDEPDREAFERAGIHCLLKRGPMGSWCGYVAVPSGHPWHGKDWHDVECDVHGGPTFGGESSGDRTIAGKPDLWWIGFDCAHSGDRVPGLGDLCPMDRYRTLGYARRHCESLAEQAAAAVPA